MSSPKSLKDEANELEKDEANELEKDEDLRLGANLIFEQVRKMKKATELCLTKNMDVSHDLNN